MFCWPQAFRVDLSNSHMEKPIRSSFWLMMLVLVVLFAAHAAYCVHLRLGTTCCSKTAAMPNVSAAKAPFHKRADVLPLPESSRASQPVQAAVLHILKDVSISALMIAAVSIKLKFLMTAPAVFRQTRYRVCFCTIRTTFQTDSNYSQTLHSVQSFHYIVFSYMVDHELTCHNPIGVECRLFFYTAS
jgi:hypothetical protein